MLEETGGDSFDINEIDYRGGWVLFGSGPNINEAQNMYFSIWASSSGCGKSVDVSVFTSGAAS